MNNYLFIINCNFIENIAKIFGGAIGISRHWMNNDITTQLQSYNNAPNYQIYVENSNFNYNTILNEDVINEKYGSGAIALFSEYNIDNLTLLDINNCKFNENKVYSQGGCNIYNMF